MKKLHHHFIHHLRSYRTFHFMFFTFFLVMTSITFHFFGSKSYAQDLLEQAFQPAMSNETIINLGAGKNAVGNEVLRQGVGIQDDGGFGCFVDGNKINEQELKTMVCENVHQGTRDTKAQECIITNGVVIINDDEKEPFCQNVLGGNWNVSPITNEAPLIVRIAKFLLRITMVLAVTMVIFNGIMWIIESSKGAEIKDAKQNMILIVVGIFIALMSLGIINLISSLTVSSLS